MNYCKECKYMQVDRYVYRARRKKGPTTHPCLRNPGWIVSENREACTHFEPATNVKKD